MLTKLPDNLTVGGDLKLNWSELSELPKNLNVNGALEIRETPLAKKIVDEHPDFTIQQLTGNYIIKYLSKHSVNVKTYVSI
jgi:hypothetical protein